VVTSSLRGETNEFASDFAACTIAAFGSSTMTFDALGQKQSLKEQVVGTWTLLSWEQKRGDGTKVERYGTSPKGKPSLMRVGNISSL
jgi:hypothetical protein